MKQAPNDQISSLIESDLLQVETWTLLSRQQGHFPLLNFLQCHNNFHDQIYGPQVYAKNYFQLPTDFAGMSANDSL